LRVCRDASTARGRRRQCETSIADATVKATESITPTCRLHRSTCAVRTHSQSELQTASATRQRKRRAQRHEACASSARARDRNRAGPSPAPHRPTATNRSRNERKSGADRNRLLRATCDARPYRANRSVLRCAACGSRRGPSRPARTRDPARACTSALRAS